MPQAMKAEVHLSDRVCTLTRLEIFIRLIEIAASIDPPRQSRSQNGYLTCYDVWLKLCSDHFAQKHAQTSAWRVFFLQKGQ